MIGTPLRRIAVCFAIYAISTTAIAQERGVERSITRKRPSEPRVAQTPAEHHHHDGPFVDDPEQFQYEYDYDTHCGLNCTRCGGVGCDLLWARAEYLMFWGQGMRVPPLVTTSPQGTDVAEAGVLGQQGTTILYGGDEILRDMRNGGKFTVGKWFDCCKNNGIEFDYFFLGEISERFQASGFGDPIIMRPFFNAAENEEDAQIVSFPGELGGTITIDSTSQVEGGGVRLLWNVLRNTHCNLDSCGHAACGATCTRIDVLAGYRYLNLRESLRINEDLVSLDTQNPGTFDVNDIFTTDNDFHGAEFGMQWVMVRNRMEIDLLAKVALGNTRQQVGIRGFTVITPEGQASTTEPGGLLAQTSNIGDYSRDKFSVVSEFGGTLKYRLTHSMLLTAGYTFILWNDVVRPGDQIDVRVNPFLIPPADPTGGGPNLPGFTFNDTDFWLQGLRFGGELRW